MDTLVIFLASKLHIVVVVIALIIFLYATKSQKITLAVTIVLAAPLSYILGKLASMLYVTERPFVEFGIAPLVPHIADNGFPSEHTLYAMVIAGVIFMVNKRWGMVLAALAVLVGVGRILANVHHVIDVAGSVLIAIVVVYLVSKLGIFYQNALSFRIHKLFTD